MPIVFGTTILTVSYNKSTYTVSCTGQAFGENQYTGYSNIEISKSGANTWTSVSAITLWGDESVSGTLSAALGAGSYDVRVTSSDGEVSGTYSGAIKLPCGNNFFMENMNEFLNEYTIM